ncbi:colicin E3/pyocin S6 family cytotoxin [Erwinia sorbitola]|nr:colicin E3/pyocin S6 family cytotoxin [Erwinia sorbitola]
MLYPFEHPAKARQLRASNGEHLGAVDYKTGEQLKPAVKGRNIKRYL